VFFSASSPRRFFFDDGRSHEHDANGIRFDHSTLRFRFDRPGQDSPATQLDTRSIGAAQIDAVIRVYDAAGNLIETHEHKGDFKE